MSWTEHRDGSRRLTILRALSTENDGRLNGSDIGAALDLYGHRVSRAEVLALLDWLEAAGALRLARPGATVVVAEITQRGEDHLARRGEPIEGVARPSRL